VKFLLYRLPLLSLTIAFSLGNTPGAVASKEFENIAAFEEIKTPFTHVWDETVHPFSGAAVIDVDGDGAMEVFVGGGNNQDDALLEFSDGRLQNIIVGSGLSNLAATYGSVSVDIDNDDDVDLIVARNDGLYLYLNNAGHFSERVFPLSLPEAAVPFSIAVSDIDHDGDADLYISVFVDFDSFTSGVFNDPDHAKANIMLLNNGDLIFSDITASSGTAGRQNSFLSVFTDLDNDGWQDLVVAQNTGEIEIFRNNRDRTFASIPVDSGFGFWMGLAVGDIDKDGDQDLFFSNVGDSIPAFLTTGDIRDDQRHNLDWLLLRNDGNFEFSDVTVDYGIDDEGFAWGAIFEDLNLDGQLDLLVAQNYLKWPIHKLFKLSGKTYLQTSDGSRFEQVKALGLENKNYGQSPLTVDLDMDGRADILWLNMNGPLRAFLNRSTAKHFVVRVPDQAAFLGTRISIETSAGKSYTREVVTSTGMLSDQSPVLTFGLGDVEKVDRVVIDRPDGSRKIIESPGFRIRLADHF
jgi:hypothetical protein